MKRLALLLAAVPFVASALNVPTTPQPRVAVLEELTGIHCSNCPSGHSIANQIKANYPDLFIPINLHAGGYATPNRTEPDFRTDYTIALNTFLSPPGYPNGSMNRTPAAGRTSLCTGREMWASQVRDIADQISPVNVWAAASVDPDTRQLTVNIEGFFTSDMSSDRIGLNVWLLQDGILGPQTGGGMGDKYVHNHMFRHNITPTWGDMINGKAAGESFIDAYSYVIPEAFRDVPCDLGNISVVVAITAEDVNHTIITACEAPVTGAGNEPDPTVIAATMKANDIDNRGTYGYNFFEGIVTSQQPTPITSLQFTVQDFSGHSTKVDVECEIAPHQAALVEIPFSYTMSDSRNRYSVYLTGINGQSFEGADALEYSFQRPGVFAKDLTFKILTDDKAADNRFLLRNADGEIIREFGPYESDNAQEYTETASLPGPGFYCFEVRDAWKDGMLNPSGWIKIYDTDLLDSDPTHALLAVNSNITGAGLRYFFEVPDDSGIESIEAIETPDAAARYYTIDGLPATRLTPGIYIEVRGATARKIRL